MPSSLFLLSLCAFFTKPATGCHTFNGTRMAVRSLSGEFIWTSVTGCLERKALGDIVPIEVQVKGEKIPHLRKDDVRHMVRLLALSFDNCQIWDVEPALFRNVPRLRYVNITFNDFLDVKRGVFSSLPSLEVLTLNNNNIDRIEDGAFGNATRLQEVYCHHNRLEEWREEWFTNSTNLQVVDFRYNRIKVVPSLANLNKLREVHFDFNELDTVQPDAFRSLRHLDYLGLRHNRFTRIDHRMFPWDFTIEFLSVGANYLNYLPRRVLAKITVREMEVQGNPWKCPCLDQIFSWLYETNATVRKMEECGGKSVPVCTYSSLYPHSCLEKEDGEVTEYFLQTLREHEPPLSKNCARLD